MNITIEMSIMFVNYAIIIVQFVLSLQLIANHAEMEHIYKLIKIDAV